MVKSSLVLFLAGPSTQGRFHFKFYSSRFQYLLGFVPSKYMNMFK